MIALPEKIAEEFRQNVRQRDELALKLGVATYEYEQQKANYQRLIVENLRQERTLKERVKLDLGLSPDKNYQLNLDKQAIEEV